MKFRVTRASVYGDGVQPCEEAKSGQMKVIDERGVDDPSKIPNGEDWYARGTNHRVENGHIKRDLGFRTAWFVDIGSLKDLMAFIDKYGDVVVSRTYSDGTTPEIKIYDDYIE